VGEVSRKLSMTEQAYYRWRREYGGMRGDQARRLKRRVADLSLDNAILKEVARGNF
jgi:putative transposase